LPASFELRSADGRTLTCLRPVNQPGVVAELSELLPHEPALTAARIYAAKDDQLVVIRFAFDTEVRFDPAADESRQHLQSIQEYVATHESSWSDADVISHSKRCSMEYVQTVSPLRFCDHWRLFEEVSGTEGTTVRLGKEEDPNESRIVVGVTNITTQHILARYSRRLSHSSINIHRAYLDQIEDAPNGNVTLFGFVVCGPDGGRLVRDSELWRELYRDLIRLKWLDERTLELGYQHRELGLLRGEVLTGLCDLVHQKLVKQNAYAFKQDRILRLLHRNVTMARKVADLFLAKFDPSNPISPNVFDARLNDLTHEVTRTVDIEDARTILTTMIEAIAAVLRTNVFLEDRYALSMRIDPRFLHTADREEDPYGVFFVHGRGFDGFHVRFRDISRGGVRAIRPRHEDQHEAEADRLYDEAYGLASAQQLKNKDIPEGGSKAAVLLHPEAKLDRSVKAFADALLDLITPDPETRSFIIDHFGEPELLYLGPDENIQPHHINWIIERAHRRGYVPADAFMSSKPGAGINHKVYGVTSEGVNVFMDVALRAIGIDPTSQPFTVKITGGPDGDVAGNMIKIMRRDYGENGRVIGIADGSGVGEDPKGLDYDELLRLFESGLPIASFDTSKLSPQGRVVTIEQPDGVRLRNTLHNRLVADAFVPAGGRPNTVHEGNWRDFLQHDGSPSARVVIEGANSSSHPKRANICRTKACSFSRTVPRTSAA
jgi:glutamate dehydrogenase